MPEYRFGYPADPPPDKLLTVHPDMDPAFVDVYSSVRRYTMTSPERMYALWEAVRHVDSVGIDGAFVECGVWRGGSSMVAALTLIALGDTTRDLWLYDTFSGMPEPDSADRDFAGQSAAALIEEAGSQRDLVVAYASAAEVRANLETTSYPPSRIRLVAGMVEDTIPLQAPERIAVLRLDTDWESSTRHELEHLWPCLAPGGVLIIDDYGHWAGARRAVDEFFAGRRDAPLLARVDYTGRVGVKPA